MKNRTTLIILPALLLPFALIACGAEDVASEDVKTSGMYANYEAIASGNGSTTVRAELRVGGDNGTYVELSGDDELVASADDDDKNMTHDSSGNRHWYESNFGTDAGGTVFNIAFNRAEGDDSAPDSSVDLPPPFAVSLEGADAGDDIQRGYEIEISWDTEFSGSMHWEVDGSCIWNEDGTVSDTGGLIIDAATIRPTGTGEGDTCEVTVTLERINEGDVDSAFEEGGRFLGIQRRAITFMSTPSDEELGEPTNEGGAGGAE